MLCDMQQITIETDGTQNSEDYTKFSFHFLSSGQTLQRSKANMLVTIGQPLHSSDRDSAQLVSNYASSKADQSKQGFQRFTHFCKS